MPGALRSPPAPSVCFVTGPLPRDPAGGLCIPPIQTRERTIYSSHSPLLAESVIASKMTVTAGMTLGMADGAAQGAEETEQMNDTLAGKYILVTGATSGMGTITALRLAERGLAGRRTGRDVAREGSHPC